MFGNDYPAKQPRRGRKYHPWDGLRIQKTIINAAVAAGVKVFLAFECGIDTSNLDAPKSIPFLESKIEALDYIKSKQDKISWAA